MLKLGFGGLRQAEALREKFSSPAISDKNGISATPLHCKSHAEHVMLPRFWQHANACHRIQVTQWFSQSIHSAEDPPIRVFFAEQCVGLAAVGELRFFDVVLQCTLGLQAQVTQ